MAATKTRGPKHRVPDNFTLLASHCDMCRELVSVLGRNISDHEAAVSMSGLMQHQLNDAERRAFWARVHRKLRDQWD